MKEDNEPTISIREAARRLARMAAKDGVVSSNEKKLLKEFADKYELDPKSLYRMAHAAAKETFYLIPDESISDDGIIYIDKCEKFSCDNSPEAFHLQISEYLKQSQLVKSLRPLSRHRRRHEEGTCQPS